MKKFFNLQRFAAISNTDSNVVITGVDYYDSVSNSGDYVRIYLGNGDDTIDNYGDFVTMSGGEGNNYIYNYVGEDSRIMTGGGDDFIENYAGDYASISTGSGNDTVWNTYSANVTISTGDGNDSVRIYAPDYTSDVLDKASDNLVVNLGNGDDTYTDYTSSVYHPDNQTVVSDSGNNYIYLDGDYGVVYTGNGNDTISGGTGAKLNGGEGNNSISSSGGNVTIIAGGGKDTINVYGNNNTITAGAGDDSIYLSGYNNIINYTYGEGNDTIVNFSAYDTLNITTPKDYSTVKSGNDLYLNFDNGTITLRNVGLTVGRLNFAVTNTGINYSGGNATVTNYTAEEAINYQTDFTGLGFTDTDFIVHSSSGSLTIQNARDKLMNFAVNGNTVARALMSSGGGEINGGSFGELTVFIGGNEVSNIITAGNGNSSLWGGTGGTDTLTGGAGQDIFFFGKNDGADVINNASSSDVVNLYDVSLSDIVAANISGNAVSATFNTGATLQINGTENLSPTFRLADGSWKFNHTSGNWQSA